jgi:hypothetical protein
VLGRYKIVAYSHSLTTSIPPAAAACDTVFQITPWKKVSHLSFISFPFFFLSLLFISFRLVLFLPIPGESRPFLAPKILPPSISASFPRHGDGDELAFFFFSFLGPISDSLSGLAIAGVVLGIETEVSR